jgi:hypothetical protein
MGLRPNGLKFDTQKKKPPCAETRTIQQLHTVMRVVRLSLNLQGNVSVSKFTSVFGVGRHAKMWKR